MLLQSAALSMLRVARRKLKKFCGVHPQTETRKIGTVLERRTHVPEEEEAAREYSAEFKLQAVQRALAGERIAEIADELGIPRKLIYTWKDRYAEHGEAGLAQPRGRPRKPAEPQPQHEPTTNRGELLAARRRIAELERKVGQQELELDFFEQVLQRVTAVRKTMSEKPSTPASSITSKKSPDKSR